MALWLQLLGSNYYSVITYLRRYLLEEWDRLPMANVQRLIHSMRRRCDACITAAGGATRYFWFDFLECFTTAHSWLNWVELHVTELYQCWIKMIKNHIWLIYHWITIGANLSLNNYWSQSAIFGPYPPIALTRLQTLTDSLNMPVFGFNKCRIDARIFHSAYIFGCKRNTAISANKPKYTFLLLTSVYQSTCTYKIWNQSDKDFLSYRENDEMSADAAADAADAGVTTTKP